MGNKYQVLPDLTPIEYEALKADIAENGVLVPVEVDESGDLLDGHHRVRAWAELKSEGVNLPDYPFILRPGLTEPQKRNHARRLNINRRQLTKDQRQAVAKAMIEDRDQGVSTREAIKEAAEVTGVSERQIDRDTKDIRKKEKDERKERILELSALGWSQRQIADEIGVDAATVNRSVAKSTIVDFATPLPGIMGAGGEAGIAQAASVANYAAGGSVTLQQAQDSERADRKAQKELERIDRINSIAKSAKPLDSALSQRYPVLYADPPWRYEHSKTDNRKIENQYPTMALEEICQLPVSTIAAADAILFMWTTSPKLAESLQALESWGFTYRTCFVWVKDKIGMGYYARQRHELLLVAKRGNIPVPPPALRFDSVIEAPRGQHSAKPHVVYEMIEKMYPDFARLELFARNRRDGWDSWGNQANG